MQKLANGGWGLPFEIFSHIIAHFLLFFPKLSLKVWKTNLQFDQSKKKSNPLLAICHARCVPSLNLIFQSALVQILCLKLVVIGFIRIASRSIWWDFVHLLIFFCGRAENSLANRLLLPTSCLKTILSTFVKSPPLSQLYLASRNYHEWGK